jgi:hypothetical protein
MASIRCAHCKNTHTSVAEVRSCAAASRHPVGTQYNGTVATGGGEGLSTALAASTLDVGHIVTLHSFPGRYWEVDQVIPGTAPGTKHHVVLISAGEQDTRWIQTREVAQHWVSLNAAADELISETERTFAAQPERPESQPARRESVHDWGYVSSLRSQMRAHLVREERGKRVGYFALLTEDNGADVVKFYRVRTGSQRGKWVNHLFVDAQASDEFYPVRAKDTLTAVLEGILADPAAAGLLYATQLGRCCRCRRTLTDETSRALGIGPECRKKG